MMMMLIELCVLRIKNNLVTNASEVAIGHSVNNKCSQLISIKFYMK